MINLDHGDPFKSSLCIAMVQSNADLNYIC